MAEDSRDSLSLTDDEDEDYEDDANAVDLSGTLCKWTNYLHGWQDRYIVLKDGTLSYYKSENETSFGCRGAVSLTKAVISRHEFDECRFDVSVNDCLWYLRARNEEEREQWMDALEAQKTESGYGSECSLRRHGSMLSLTSGTSLSTASASSFKRGRGLREKLAEMETFRDILCRQVDTLQNYFDACAAALANQSVHDHVEVDDIDDVEDFHSPNNHSSQNQKQTIFTQMDATRESDIENILQQHGAHAIDFKGEAFTFKATTAGILSTLSHCIELMSQRDDAWRKRLEKEVEKRKKLAETYKTMVHDRSKPIVVGGPDYEEGPHSIITEDEFFDAVDATLDKMEKEEEKRLLLKKTESLEKPPLTSLSPTHPFYDEINRVVHDHISHADMSASDVADTWQLIAEEGDMRVFKREQEEDGLIVDPIKAVHTVKGITGHELCHYFWDPTVRMEWENTLDSANVLEYMSKDTCVVYQVHKRVWPASQRDSCFWSTIRHCPSEDDEGPDYWIVANHMMDHKASPTSKCVRMKFNVALVCQTIVTPPPSGQPITREHLTCRIQYTANVNPGGWCPASVIRVISKREVPKFLKTFTQYVVDKRKTEEILL